MERILYFLIVCISQKKIQENFNCSDEQSTNTDALNTLAGLFPYITM